MYDNTKFFSSNVMSVGEDGCKNVKLSQIAIL